jgi:hypothetical protein
MNEDMFWLRAAIEQETKRILVLLNDHKLNSMIDD